MRQKVTEISRYAKIRFYQIIGLLLLFSFCGSAQDIADSVAFDSSSVEESNLLFIDASYSSKNAKFSSSTENNPVYVSSLFYAGKKGLTLNTSLINFPGVGTSTYEFDFNLGYDKTIESFDFGATMGYHSFSGDINYQSIDYSFAATAHAGFNANWFDVFADYSFMSGVDLNNFFDVGMSAYLYKESIFSKNDMIDINPTVSLAFGTDYWVTESMSIYESAEIKRFMRYKGYQLDEFSFISTDFMVPVSYSIYNISLSFTWIYSIYADKYIELGMSDQSAYMFSLMYTLNFK